MLTIVSVVTKPVFEVGLKGMLGLAAERRKNNDTMSNYAIS